MSIALPIRLTPEGIAQESNLKLAIDTSLELILRTSLFSTPADPGFGFIFNNLRFEIFNEHEGVVYDSGDTNSAYDLPGLYSKTISGSSKNLNTFAAELKDTVVKYEKRLSNVTASMTYIREEKRVYVTIKGVITATNEEYLYTNILKVWN